MKILSRTDFSALKGRIDFDSAIISGVSVITEGDAKGHGMKIDAQSLRDVKAAAETYIGGLKVKTDHYTGFNEIVGALRNFQIDGKQLRADLYLLKNHEATPRILEMAELMPDTFGLSIAFTGDHHKDDNGTIFARCSEIYSADLVDSPAANPTGLFIAKVDKLAAGMDEEKIAEAIAEALAPLNEKLSELETKLTSLEEIVTAPDDKKDDSEQGNDDENEKQDDNSSELAAELAEIKKLIVNFGSAPVKVAAASDKKEDAEPTTFEAALAKVKSEGLSGTKATLAAITRYPELYRDARSVGIQII